MILLGHKPVNSKINCSGIIVVPTAYLITEDNTEATLYEMTMKENCIYLFEAWVTATFTGSATRGGTFIILAQGRNSIFKAVEDTVLYSNAEGSLAAVMDLSGNNARVRVTGFSSVNVKWSCILKYMRQDGLKITPLP